jgi:prepilin-type N-terminal cleavage/methylation domain-containing protein
MKPRPQGFTLIELLVALALTGIVTVLMLGALRNAALGLDRLSRKTDAFDRHHALDALLRRQLGATLAIVNLPSDLPGFAGAPTHLQFVTSAGGGAGLYQIDLDYRNRQLTLTRRAGDFRLAYFGALPFGAEPAWHDSWDTVRYLPRLVRVTIEDGDGGERPPLIVRLWGGDG